MKIGFVGFPASGHLHPMTALARKLQSRGHEVIFIGVLDSEPIVRAAGLRFVPYCEEEFPAGSLAKVYAPVAKMHGLEIATLTTEQLLGAIRKTLENPSYRERARYFQKVIGETHGLEVAADRIEQAFQMNTPASDRISSSTSVSSYFLSSG